MDIDDLILNLQEIRAKYGNLNIGKIDPGSAKTYYVKSILAGYSNMLTGQFTPVENPSFNEDKMPVNMVIL